MKKTSIHLLISSGMTEREEDELIRFSYRVRQHLSLGKDTLRLGREGYETDVEVRSALLEDVKMLAEMRKVGKISEEDSLNAGFVSRKLYSKIAGGIYTKHPDVWLSDGCEALMVGADPEFGFIRADGLLEFAESVLPNSKTKKFGADGPGVEVRPDPSRNHLEVVTSISKILAKPPAGAEQYKWIGGATFRDRRRTYWFGGHIHLGRPVSLQAERSPAAFSALARVLDHYLALPFLTFDTPEPYLRRDGCTHRYGLASDIRVKDNYGRFEYRTLSGVWLTHPTLARIAIGVTKAVAEDFYKRSASVDHNSNFLTAGHTSEYGLTRLAEVAKLINAAQSKSLSAELLDYWKTLMANLLTREEYAEEVDALIQLVENSPDGVVPQLNMDIRENWQKDRPLLLEPNKTLEKALRAVEEKK